MKVVLDTNVVVAAFVLQGRTAQLSRFVETGELVPVVSDGLVSEYIRVLTRPKMKLGAERAVLLVQNAILARSVCVNPKEITKVCRDPDDDGWVALAREAGVPLVTGDGDILALRGMVAGLEVWTAAELVEKLAA